MFDGWKDMSKPATEYGYGGNGELDFFDKLERDALDTIDPYVDFTQYDRLVFIRTGKTGVRFRYSRQMDI